MDRPSIFSIDALELFYPIFYIFSGLTFLRFVATIEDSVSKLVTATKEGRKLVQQAH